jgi:hypothetical protein
MYILTNGKGNIGSNQTSVISSAVTLNVGPTSSTTSNITAYGAYYTNGVTAMQIPSGTTSTRPVTAGAGYLRYNTDIHVVEYYRSAIATWLPLYSPPRLDSIDISAAITTYIPRNAAGTQYLNLRGFNFELDKIPFVFFYGLDGSTNFISPSVTWKSYQWVVAQIPSGVYTGTSEFIASVSPYSVRITSAISGMSQTLVNALAVGADPVFNQSQTNPLPLPYFNSRSYSAGVFNAGSIGVGIGNYISAFDASNQPIIFSKDPSNNSQYAPYNLDLSWNPTPVPDANGNYYAYFITTTTIPNNAVSAQTTITLGVVATNTVTGQFTKGAFKIIINPYYIVSTFTSNTAPLSGSVTVTQGYLTNVYPAYYTSLVNPTTNTTPTYTTNSYPNTAYPTTWTTPSSRTTFRYNYNVTCLGCPGTTADPSNNNIVDFLLVGGGGGGGNGYQSGGGGAGGLISSNSNFGACGGGGAALTSTGYVLSNIGTYVIQVGGGGCGAVYQLSSAPNTSGQPALVSPVTIPGSPSFQGDNTTFFGFTAAGGGYGAGEMNFLNNSDGNSNTVPVGAPSGLTSPLQGATNMSVSGTYGTLSTVTPSGTVSGNPWCVGPSLYNPRCDWNPLAGGCGGGGSHGQLTQNVGVIPQGAVGNYNPAVSLSGTTITGPVALTGTGSTQGYAGGNGYTSSPYVGGGGGGAGGVGGNADVSGTPGNGGNGLVNTINNVSTTYACGGGGATRGVATSQGGSSSVNGGKGYSFNNSSTVVTATQSDANGTNGTGTGGGGWGQPGVGNAGQAGNGGNGIAIIRYPRVSGIT